MILEPQAVADLVGFLANAFDARTADEGRSAFSAKDGKTRSRRALFNDRLNLYSDPMHPDLPAVPATGEGIPASRLSLIKGGVLENLEYSRFWAQEQKREPTPGPVNYILESTQPPTSAGRHDQGDGARPAHLALLVRPSRRSAHHRAHRPDPRRALVDRERQDQHPVRNLRFNQSVLAMLAPWNVEAIGAPQRRSPLMVPALKLGAFTFTSISDAI